jgi:hypothetical protein
MSTIPTSDKIVGYDVVIYYNDGTKKSFHKKGSEAAVNRWAILKIGHTRHELTGTYTREQWLRTWGEGRM